MAQQNGGEAGVGKGGREGGRGILSKQWSRVL